MDIQGVTSKQKSLDKYLKEKASYYKKAFMKVLRAELQAILEEVSITGPAHTGASAGEIERQIDPVPKWHPAFGMNIGHMIGDSGWQIIEEDSRLVLINPMWDPYLKYLELGVVPGNYTAHFVQTAWNNHLKNRAKFRKMVKDAG